MKHFMYGISIDEGNKGIQALTLAWDVLYPEVFRFMLLFKCYQHYSFISIADGCINKIPVC